MTKIEYPLTPWRFHAGGWLSCPLTAIYDTSDPYAVTWRFHDGTAWMFARDLLAQGLHEPAGHRQYGDVLFLPLANVVEVALNSPYGSVALIFDPDGLRAFLDASTKLVPLGEEQIDWDAAMRSLGGAR